MIILSINKTFWFSGFFLKTLEIRHYVQTQDFIIFGAICWGFSLHQPYRRFVYIPFSLLHMTALQRDSIISMLLWRKLRRRHLQESFLSHTFSSSQNLNSVCIKSGSRLFSHGPSSLPSPSYSVHDQSPKVSPPSWPSLTEGYAVFLLCHLLCPALLTHPLFLVFAKGPGK